MPMTNPSSKWLKSTEWLAGQIGKPGIVVVDGSFYLPAQKRDANAEYVAGHIPGAVFFDIEKVAVQRGQRQHEPGQRASERLTRQMAGAGRSLRFAPKVRQSGCLQKTGDAKPRIYLQCPARCPQRFLEPSRKEMGVCEANIRQIDQWIVGA